MKNSSRRIRINWKCTEKDWNLIRSKRRRTFEWRWRWSWRCSCSSLALPLPLPSFFLVSPFWSFFILGFFPFTPTPPLYLPSSLALWWESHNTKAALFGCICMQKMQAQKHKIQRYKDTQHSSCCCFLSLSYPVAISLLNLPRSRSRFRSRTAVCSDSAAISLWGQGSWGSGSLDTLRGSVNSSANSSDSRPNRYGFPIPNSPAMQFAVQRRTEQTSTSLFFPLKKNNKKLLKKKKAQNIFNISRKVQVACVFFFFEDYFVIVIYTYIYFFCVILVILVATQQQYQLRLIFTLSGPLVCFLSSGLI